MKPSGAIYQGYQDALIPHRFAMLRCVPRADPKEHLWTPDSPQSPFNETGGLRCNAHVRADVERCIGRCRAHLNNPYSNIVIRRVNTDISAILSCRPFLSRGILISCEGLISHLSNPETPELTWLRDVIARQKALYRDVMERQDDIRSKCKHETLRSRCQRMITSLQRSENPSFWSEYIGVLERAGESAEFLLSQMRLMFNNPSKPPKL